MIGAALFAAALAIPQAGVVEGFYGRPWPHQGRVELVRFLGGLGLNTYIYGPKDDPYHHAKWREAYPAEKAKEFGELLAAAKANKVDLYWAVHLGDAFKDEAPAAKEAEYAALFAKLESMYALGFRAFAAFFDDFGGTNATLHAEIANRVVTDFLDRKGDCPDLIVCPHDYAGLAGSEYCRIMGERCGKRVQLMWTGPNICAEIPADAVESVAKVYRRAPFVWWNWPVNDFNRGKLVMGPMYGVAPCGYAGFVLNPMENLEASKLSIYCASEFAKNPAAFDPQRAWEAGLKALYGDELAPAMRVFCDHNSDTAGGPRSHEEWIADWNRRESEALAAGGSLREECLKIRAAMAALKAKLPTARPALWGEIRHWVEMLDAQAEEGLAAIAGDRAAYDAAKARRQTVFSSQQEYFAGLAPEWDKKNCQGCITGTRLLQPMIDVVAKAAFGAK